VFIYAFKTRVTYWFYLFIILFYPRISIFFLYQKGLVNIQIFSFRNFCPRQKSFKFGVAFTKSYMFKIIFIIFTVLFHIFFIQFSQK